MGGYRYMEKAFKDEYSVRSELFKKRVAVWRGEGAVTRIGGPTNIARARKLGYKAKEGVVVARVKVERGLRKRIKPRGGRKPSKSGRFFALRKSAQAIAEERAGRRFSNCEVLNSYYVGEDGEYKFFEVIMVDRSHPAIVGDASYAGIINHNGRVYRGLTNAGIKHRGMRVKGFGTNRNRPSVRSSHRHILRV